MFNIEKLKEVINNYTLNKTKKSGLVLSNDEKKVIKLRKVFDELEKNHNHSLYAEVWERNKNNLDDEAIFYRGTSISYRKLFNNVQQYVKSFTNMGIDEKSEIPMCISNTPEFIYMLLAASYVGAKVNSFGTEFDDDYITQIINECSNCNYVFVSDDNYEHIKNAIDNSNTSNVVMFSLTDSIENKNYYNSKFYKQFNIPEEKLYFVNKVNEFKNNNNSIIDNRQFLARGYTAKYKEPYKSSLDDVFTTTYSSGSTNSTRPKGIVHINRSYIAMGRSHDTDLSNAPSMHGLRILAMIPSHSNTDVMSNITDTLIQGSCIAPEPVGEEDFLLNSLILNRPNFVTATRSLVIEASKLILLDDKIKNIKLRMPYLFALFSVGEPTTFAEEKFINKALKKVHAGQLWLSKIDDKYKIDGKLPISFPLSIAGGDCEHGGIFYTMFKSWFEAKERMLGHLAKEEHMGMNTHQMVSCIVLDENGNVVEDGKMGRLYATSLCNMKGYRNNEEATNKFFKEINGTIYGDCSVLASKDKYGRISVKGRISNDYSMDINKLVIKLNDTILSDVNNVMSCEVIPQKYNDDYIFVAHVEFNPLANIDKRQALAMIDNKCKNLFGDEISNKIYYRVHGDSKSASSYPLTGCGKRSNLTLKAEGLTKAVKPVYYEGYDSYDIKTADELLLNENVKQIVKK